MTKNQELPITHATAAGLTLEERILAVEAALPYRRIPGASVARVVKETEELEWCWLLGQTIFRGPSLEDVVAQGEAAVAKMTGVRPLDFRPA